METFPATSETVACTLGPSDLRDVEAAWRKLLSQSLVARDEVRGGVRLTVDPRSAGVLRRLIDIERECCPWIAFAVDGSTVTMTAPGPGAWVIRQMWKGKE